MATETAEQKVEHLRQHFLSKPSHEQAAGWEDMWQKKITPWDRATPNLALVDVLNNKHTVIGQPLKDDGTRKTALVPGCGRGYDVVLLSSYGYDAVGLDTAATAVRSARELQQKEQEQRRDYPIHDDKVGAGKGSFFEANFFEDAFLSQAQTTFDLIYDYTFLCALPPDLRPQWAKRMSDLLAPGGTLICLEFPLGKPLSAGGPPHGLTSEVYLQLFKRPGSEVQYEDGKVVTSAETASVSALKRIDHWAPERSHHAGQGKDMVSLWQHA